MTFRVSIEGSQAAFGCEAGQSLLDAGLKAGIELPYSCRKGICGNCAGTVSAGEVVAVDGTAMSNENCAPGQVLYCLCTPTSDVTVRPVSWRRADPGARKSFTVKVHKNLLVAPDVSVLQLRLPAGQRAKFRAGQYLQVMLDDGSTRSYSMANAPHESDSVTLHVRHLPGGRFSGQVASMAPGTQLRIELPFGSVEVKEDAPHEIVFVGGGTGFAPIKSIIDDMARRRVQRPITLIWGARRADGLYLLGAVDKWRRTWPDFRFIAALSDEPVDGSNDAPASKLDAFAGRVDAALRQHRPNLAGSSIYCCGSPVMVAAVRVAAVRDCGLEPENFHADVFVDGPAETTDIG